MSQFSRETLSGMVLSDLRTMGREVGVKSPCSRDKATLIELILAVTEGRVAPTVTTRGRKPVARTQDFMQPTQRTKRGRPRKNNVEDDAISVAAPIIPTEFQSANDERGESDEQQDADAIIKDVQYVEPKAEQSKQTASTEQPPQAQQSPSAEQPISTEQSAPMEQSAPAIEEQSSNDDIFITGVLELLSEGYGFLRVDNFNNSSADVYVPPVQIRRFGLRSGDKIECKARAFRDKTLPSLIYIFKINDVPCEQYSRRERFEDLVSCYPDKRLTLEMDKNEYSLRLIDLVAPIGKGQRGLIVAAPKTGKTILLKKIAQAVRANHPEIHLVVLLIDERPEEVTDFRQSVDCDVAYSTFDQNPTHHVQTAELVLANAKRRVELGQDVMILLDSITRLGRAYNQLAVNSGRTMTGGLDISALQEPKRFFGAGRNVTGQGSLTILATALIDTGSKMDDIIYEEFKGTGNMEIHLDRRMSEKRIFPAIDLARSGTRREEMLLTQAQLEGMWMIRRALSRTDTVEATEQLLDILMGTSNNEEFINVLKVITKNKKI